MDNKLLQDLENAYADWEESEHKFAHENSVYAILDTLDPDNDRDEYNYQLLRLKYSPAYFSGHPAWCGERWNQPNRFDITHYEMNVRWFALFTIIHSICTRRT